MRVGRLHRVNRSVLSAKGSVPLAKPETRFRCPKVVSVPGRSEDVRAVKWSPETRIEQWRNRPSSFPQSQLFERGLALMKNFTRRSTIAGVATLALVGTGSRSPPGPAPAGQRHRGRRRRRQPDRRRRPRLGPLPDGSTTSTFTVTNPNPYTVKLNRCSTASPRNVGVHGEPHRLNVSNPVQRHAEPDRSWSRRRRHGPRSRHGLDGQHLPTTARVRASRSTYTATGASSDLTESTAARSPSGSGRGAPWRPVAGGAWSETAAATLPRTDDAKDLT